MTRYIIDITRFISRIGRGKPTGIDRVESAYFQAVFDRDPGCLAIGKIGSDFVLCAGQAVQKLFAAVRDGDSIGRLGLKDGFRLKLPREQRQARQYLRNEAQAVSPSIGAVLSDANLRDVEYINVGHSNLNDTVFQALREAGCSKITVMIHDMIPLDFPQFTREGISAQFEDRMRSVALHADRILCNSEDTKMRVQSYFRAWGADPEFIVAHLGVEPLATRTWEPSNPPYFACLGTIEPRKNHALLFDVWEALAKTMPSDDVPALHVIGRRGWKNEDVFAFLDGSPLMGKHIQERSNLDDEELAEDISQCAALLFPSFAEGFGLPALEAAQMGVPVICSDLPIFHEILGDYGTYLDPNNAELWSAEVESVAKIAKEPDTNVTPSTKKAVIPRWESHFRHVFDDTGDRQVIHE